jgi:hypothetical protein
MVPDGGEVAFLLHDTFAPSIRLTKFSGESANLDVTAYEDFTVAAIIYDGTTLELDLSEIPGLPAKFYAEYIPDDFREEVSKLMNETPILVPEDLHRHRWGGKKSANGYSLSAIVEPDDGSFHVQLTVESTHPDDHVAHVAFLLHDSIKDPVRFRRVGKGKASCSVRSLEAFTAAAILPDGTSLELDLNDRSLDYPKNFYYEEPPSMAYSTN